MSLDFIPVAQLSSVLRARKQFHPLVRDFGLTAATQLVTFSAGLLVISLFGKLLGPARLGEYLLLRRVLGWLLSGVQLGLGIALARYVARAVASLEEEPDTYFLAALSCLGIVAASVGVLLSLDRRTFALWIFGNPQMVRLVLPLSMMVAGTVVHSCVFGYYRGRLLMGRANALQCVNLGCMPVVATVGLFRTGSVALIVDVMGICTFLSAMLFAIPIFHRLLRNRPAGVVRHATELLSYGAPRTIGDFGGSALFALGPVIASHYVPITQVTYLLLGISLLMAMSVSAGPLGLVLLSKVSMMLAQNRTAEIRTHLEHMLAAVIELSLFLCLQVVVFTDVLVRLWVGPHFLSRIVVIRLLSVATPFYLFYVALRSVVDAASVKAYDARNNLTSLAVFLILSGLVVKAVPPKFLLEGLAGALLFALVVLAGLTAHTVRHLYGLRVPWRNSIAPIQLALFFGGLAFLLRWSGWLGAGLPEFVGVEVILATAFLGLVIKFGSPWFWFMWNTALVPVKAAAAVTADK